MKRLYLLLAPLVLLCNSVMAQNGYDQVSYANLALQFSEFGNNDHAFNGMYPSVTTPEGYGTYLQNPAAVALMEKDFMEFNLFNQQTDVSSTFRSGTIDSEHSSTKMGNIGFVYGFPVQRGSLVIGGGYTKLDTRRGSYTISARNNENTITESFLNPGSQYHDLAFDTYAIDYGDTDSTYLESIFRIGFPPGTFPGINQEAESNYYNDIGEYAFFLGTEFQKDLFVGASASIVTGSYSYSRDFLEIDRRNDYDGNFIPSTVSDEGTDILQILIHDEVEADVTGFDFRAGGIYKINSQFQVGASILFPSVLIISETFYSSIETQLDDNSSPFFQDMANPQDQDFTYRVKKPGTYAAGITAKALPGLDISLAADYTNHSNLSIDLVSENNFSFDDEVAYRNEQEAIDSLMSAEYNKVLNIKTGASYQINNLMKVKAGYAFLPAKTKNFAADKNVISAGFEALVHPNIEFSINGRYTLWEDQSQLYGYDDYDGRYRTETVNQEITRLQISAGIRLIF